MNRFFPAVFVVTMLLGTVRLGSAPAPAAPARLREFGWVDPNHEAPGGMVYRTLRSQTIKEDVSYLVYLPPGYAEEERRRYPVVYWLHGSGGNQRKGAEMAQRLDAATRAGKAPPMIVVGVNGLAGETMYCDTRDGRWPLETVIVHDLVPHIDATFRTIARREARGVEGFSMGGFGAAHFGFKFPEIFGVVSMLAPALLGPDIEGEQLQRKWQALFAFALSNDLDYFRANNPYDLAARHAGELRGRSLIRIVPHDTPERWLIPRCEKLHAVLDANGIANELIVHEDVKRHSFGLVYDALGDQALGFFAQAFSARRLAASDSSSPSSASWKLDLVETLPGGVEVYRVPDPARPDFQRLLAKPPGDGPFPAIVLNHGGRTGATYVRDCLAFPANGFVTLACDLTPKEIPLDDFRARKWPASMGPGASPENLRRDRDQIAILQSLPFVDPKKIAMFGHSAGGHLTVGWVALENADRAIAVAAITSAGIAPRDPERLKDPRHPGQYRVYPQLALIQAGSPPLESIKNITVPLLSIHGRLDHICPEESADTLHEELDRLGRENTLIVREAEHNDTKSPADFAEVIRYFRRHLGLPAGPVQESQRLSSP